MNLFDIKDVFDAKEKGTSCSQSIANSGRAPTKETDIEASAGGFCDKNTRD
jgi:hypothetical protein